MTWSQSHHNNFKILTFFDNLLKKVNLTLTTVWQLEVCIKLRQDKTGAQTGWQRIDVLLKAPGVNLYSAYQDDPNLVGQSLETLISRTVLFTTQLWCKVWMLLKSQYPHVNTTGIILWTTLSHRWTSLTKHSNLTHVNFRGKNLSD